MEEYRANLLGPDGQITNRIDIICADEKTAREQAWQLAHDCAVELWRDDRMIAKYPARL
ncbi:hypothetical protein [Bradyrhizobium iriomotense]|uniref:hypothetical protein n=1 Tax=Bradyrhizobium iriomotense TaxID=441950 RepID=UPI0024E158F5|nr:hypothetical protein [Bradyrhizobium iriomotense]